MNLLEAADFLEGVGGLWVVAGDEVTVANVEQLLDCLLGDLGSRGFLGLHHFHLVQVDSRN